ERRARIVLARARPLDAALLLQAPVAHPSVHGAQRPQLIPSLLHRGLAPVAPEAPGQLGDDPVVVASLARRIDGLAHSLHPPLATSHQEAEAGSTTSAISHVRVMRMSWAIRKSRLSSSSSAFLESASDWAGFSPITYRVRSSPRSIASNISERCQPVLGGSSTPHAAAKRARASWSCSTSWKPGSLLGIAPMSPPPWTLFWPRSGFSPDPKRPTWPHSSPRLISANTLSTALWCSVIPSVQQVIARSAGANACA